MADKKNEIQKKPEQQLSTDIKMSKDDLAQMYGGMEQEDVTIPRLVILQGLSPEVSEGKGSPGQFYVKGFERNVGKGPVEFIVIMRNKSRLRWRDLKLGGGIVCSSTDAKIGKGDPGGNCETCQFASWASADGRPGCDLYQNAIVVLRKDGEWVPMALSGNRTKLKALKNLNSLLMLEMMKGRPMFSKSYMLEPMQKTNPQGMMYFVYRIVPGNNNVPLPNEEQQKALEIFNSLKTKRIIVAEENPDVPTGPVETENF